MMRKNSIATSPGINLRIRKPFESKQEGRSCGVLTIDFEDSRDSSRKAQYNLSVKRLQSGDTIGRNPVETGYSLVE